MSSHESDIESPETDLTEQKGPHVNQYASEIPEKSRERYEWIYERFMEWRQENHISSFSQKDMLIYFESISKIKKPTSLVAIYSMLKTTIHLRHGVNIGNYTKLLDYLKKNAQGYKPKQSTSFTPEQITTFIQEAPDYKFLFAKVVLIMGVSGACGQRDLRSLQPENVHDTGEKLVITIQDTKPNTRRSFVVCEELYPICKKYMNLRPKQCEHLPFFVSFFNGKCKRQCVGINGIGNVSKMVAKYLCLPDENQYTGHSFRLSSAALLADSGGYQDFLSVNIRRRMRMSTADSTPTPNSTQQQEVQKIATQPTSLPEPEPEPDTTAPEKNSDLALAIASEKRKKVLALETEPDLQVTRNKKTDKRYETAYQRYIDWCAENGMQDDFSESTIMLYFTTLVQQGEKSGSLRMKYSMIRKLILHKHHVNIQRYLRLRGLIRNAGKDYEPKKKIFFAKNTLDRFIHEAPDKKYLGVKALIVVSMKCNCGCKEMTHLKISDVLHSAGNNDNIFIHIAGRRQIIISDPAYVSVLLRYMATRPPEYNGDRFFLRYVNGRCVCSPIGINTMNNIVKEIAKFFRLPDWKAYSMTSIARCKTGSNRAGAVASILKLCLTRTTVVENTEMETARDQHLNVDSVAITDPEYIKIELESDCEMDELDADPLPIEIIDVPIGNDDIKVESFEDENEDIFSVDMDTNVNNSEDEHRDVAGSSKKASPVFTKKNFTDFITTAPDYKYLDIKVALIFAAYARLSLQELAVLSTDDIQDMRTSLVIKTRIPNSNLQRFAMVSNKEGIELYRKYVALLPVDRVNNQLFVKYVDGKCGTDVTVMEQIAKFPRTIAVFLKLPYPGEYNANFFRRLTDAVNKAEVPKTKMAITPSNADDHSDKNSSEAKKEDIEINKLQNRVVKLTGSSVVINDCVNCTFHITVTPDAPEL